MIEGKSLEQWRLELRRLGKAHWGVFYKEFVGTPLSNYPRFYKALNQYGDWAMFEAILSTSNQRVIGDPISYVIKTAHNIWKENQLELEAAEDERAKVEEAFEHSHAKNLALAKKLEKLTKRKK
jgi:hypothetical protein